MHPIIKNILYGIGVFAIFSVITLILKFASGKITPATQYLEIFTDTDLLLGLAVAVVVTLNHNKKMKMKK
ncbi:MAG: hypothetical protein PHH37_08515 [Paludibacter sp.]|nr:hypothetical protein [Paludibacter sp.]